MVSDLKPNTSVPEIVIKLDSDPEEKDTRVGKLETFQASDETGQCTVNLWVDQTGKYKKEDIVKITDGWCKEYAGQLQISTGKFGTIEAVEE